MGGCAIKDCAVQQFEDWDSEEAKLYNEKFTLLFHSLAQAQEGQEGFMDPHRFLMVGQALRWKNHSGDVWTRESMKVYGGHNTYLMLYYQQ